MILFVDRYTREMTLHASQSESYIVMLSLNYFDFCEIDTFYTIKPFKVTVFDDFN